MNHDKHQKFRRLAEKRVNRALKDMELIGNLANKGNYHYSEDEVALIVKALKDGLAGVIAKFERSKGGESESFSLRQ